MTHNDSSYRYGQGRDWLARLKDFTGTLPGTLVVTIAIIALFYLMFGRLEQVLPFLPLAVLLLCPLLHVFMPHSHAGHGKDSGHLD